ncbi:MAG: hypothetical protein SO206_07255 [Bacilli bacterium]|nr:hypothetical protein [Bacilli bacterium]
MYTGKEIKELINANIEDNDIVCIGERGDSLGRLDKKIIGIEKRNIGFDNDSYYKAIISEDYGSNGAMKFFT